MIEKINNTEIMIEVEKLSSLCIENGRIDPELYKKYDVKRGLRDVNGKGVLTGLTEISEISAHCVINGEEIPCDGELFYRGVNVEDIINGCIEDKRYGFEEVTYLLLFGKLPSESQFKIFNEILAVNRKLPVNFVRDIIMKAPSPDMMNVLSRGVLTLYHYDDNANDSSIQNVLSQSIHLISVFPLLSVYGYQSYNHYNKGESLFIHTPQKNLSTAENILYLLRNDNKYTELEARVLDVALILHAEHGGGNNSTFTTHVVTSSGSDTYSVISAALNSLKGSKHGGANKKVVQMFEDMKKNLVDWSDDNEISNYLNDLLDRNAFDKKGLIYGMGHAIYTKSDPRAKVLRKFVERLAKEKGREEEFRLYTTVERLAPRLIESRRKIHKGVCPNIDFYSGFIYEMLGLPQELYTPIFAVARISGWCAHIIEELISGDKIIRPAYKSVAERQGYINFDER